MAGLPCTQWIARCAARGAARRAARPDARLPAAPRLRPAAVRPVRLRHGRSWSASSTTPARRCSTRRRRSGRAVWVVSEYGHCDVTRPVLPEPGAAARPGCWRCGRRPVRRDARHVRQPGLRRLRPSAGPRLRRRPGRRAAGARAARRRCRAWPACSPARSAPRSACDHERSGELVAAVASRTPGSPIRSGSTTAQAPDYARTVDIHRKPGYDPCELFFDPAAVVAEGARGPAACCRRSSASACCSTWSRSTPRSCGAATAWPRPTTTIGRCGSATGRGPGRGALPMRRSGSWVLDALELGDD